MTWSSVTLCRDKGVFEEKSDQTKMRRYAAFGIPEYLESVLRGHRVGTLRQKQGSRYSEPFQRRHCYLTILRLKSLVVLGCEANNIGIVFSTPFLPLSI